MKYWLDTEFNEQGGELISMGIVAEDGRELYFELPIAEEAWKPWVRANVKPLLTETPMAKETAQKWLARFFVGDGEPHICCDWPADIAHLCTMLDLGDGKRLGANRWTFELRGKLGAKSDTPHHALSDARSIRDVWPKD